MVCLNLISKKNFHVPIQMFRQCVQVHVAFWLTKISNVCMGRCVFVCVDVWMCVLCQLISSNKISLSLSHCLSRPPTLSLHYQIILIIHNKSNVLILFVVCFIHLNFWCLLSWFGVVYTRIEKKKKTKGISCVGISMCINGIRWWCDVNCFSINRCSWCPFYCSHLSLSLHPF